MHLRRIVGICLILAAVTNGLFAAIIPNALFSDGAVLQRGQDVPVWGTADKDCEVTVSFAGQQVSAKADERGLWMVRLSPLEASSEGREMVISNGRDRVVVKNVVVGEVWVCSGQSNMDYTLGSMARPTKDKIFQPLADFNQNEINTAEDPLFRQISVRQTVSPQEPRRDFSGSWLASSPKNNAGFSGTGYFFGRELRRELNIPVGLVKCAWGGTCVEPWIPMDQYQTSDEMKAYYATTMAEKQAEHVKWMDGSAKKEREEAVNAAKAQGAPAKKTKPPQDPLLQPTVPSGLYNGMIAPLVPYAVKGVIWYQGESNQSYENSKYREHFEAVVNGWRLAWKQPRLDFYWCQLALYRAPAKQPVGDDDGWVNVCYQQFQALALPNTGMAVLNDIGQPEDIHPRNKFDAGRRLAFWALNRSYGRTDLVCSGPLYKSHVIQEDKVLITFDHVGSGLMTGKKVFMDPVVETKEPLHHFQIRGADGVWKWADAKIISRDTVEVRSPDIRQPVEVRYAWAMNPKGANLYNREGLPASLFKTAP